MEGAKSHAISLVAYLGGPAFAIIRHMKHVSLGSQEFASGDRGNLGELVGIP